MESKAAGFGGNGIPGVFFRGIRLLTAAEPERKIAPPGNFQRRGNKVVLASARCTGRFKNGYFFARDNMQLFF